MCSVTAATRFYILFIFSPFFYYFSASCRNTPTQEDPGRLERSRIDRVICPTVERSSPVCPKWVECIFPFPTESVILLILLCFWFPHRATSWFLAWFLCTGNKACGNTPDMVRPSVRVTIRPCCLVAIWCYLQMLPFCISQRVWKHCVPMLFLLNLHWRAALMVFFYVFG